MTSHVLTPLEIEARAHAAGITLREVCKRAEIALSTFYRWKAGKTAPTLTVYSRICAATEVTKRQRRKAN
jgi:transcriptional regulator with XRE-family HTH domain